MREAPASSAFSTSSLTALAGRSTTSPAAMRLTVSGGRRRMGMAAGRLVDAQPSRDSEARQLDAVGHRLALDDHLLVADEGLQAVGLDLGIDRGGGLRAGFLGGLDGRGLLLVLAPEQHAVGEGRLLVRQVAELVFDHIAPQR